LKAYGFGRISYNIDIQGFLPWQESHVYPLNTLIREGLHMYEVTTAGTSGASRPLFIAVYGLTTTDGTVVWTNVDPKLTVTQFDEIGREHSLAARDVHQFMLNTAVARDRFEVFGDYQAVTLGINQRGPTARTNIYYVELEVRPYPPGADFNTGPEFGDVQIPQPT
jgi:hypothetical protein